MRAASVLSLAILAFQVYIPWSVQHLATQDGPAHIYTAFVTKDLLFHRHISPYHPIYRIQKIPLPNWTCTLVLAGFLAVWGPGRAEAFLMSVCLLTAYAALAYCMRSLVPLRSPPLLIANWLIQSWFLWGGFYNFYLGMALLPFVVGVYLRWSDHLSRLRVALLAGALLLLFFTHLIPAALAVMTLFILAAWRKASWRQFGILVAALAPTAALIAIYAVTFHEPIAYRPGIQAALQSFPGNTFVFAGGWVGDQRFVWPVVLVLIIFSIFALSRHERRGPLGGLAAAAIAIFALYLLVPDLGFGGSVVKIRFAWAFFLLGGLLVGSVERLRRGQTAIGVFVAVFLVLQLVSIARHVGIASHAIESYLAAMDRVPERVGLIRMHFPAPFTMRRFELDSLAFNPLLHLAELGAVRRHAVDLSDYQSVTGTFSVAFKRWIDSGQRYSLWSFESPGADAWASASWLRGSLPVPIDYVVYFGDEAPAALPAGVRYSGSNTGAPFVRIYRF